MSDFARILVVALLAVLAQAQQTAPPTSPSQQPPRFRGGTGSQNIKDPLVDFINRVMSDDDLVGVMTPEMGPQQITFARKTDVIERGLRENGSWAHGRALARGPGEPALFHRGPSTGNQLEPATARIFPRSDRVHLELEASRDSSTWIGAVLDRAGTKTAIPVAVGERTDSGSGKRWLPIKKHTVARLDLARRATIAASIAPAGIVSGGRATGGRNNWNRCNAV